MADKLSRVHEEASAALARLARLFLPSARLTLVVRTPELPDGTVIVTNDDAEEVVAAIRRTYGDPGEVAGG
jgi:hypothetical protein